MYNPFTLENKTIVITGASSGIGRQCAIDCSKMGARVILVARNIERLNETLTMMDGKEHLCVSFDLTQIENIPSMVDNIVKQVGRIHGVLHCAGISHVQLLQLMKSDTMESFFKTNVIGAMILTKEICRKKNIDSQGASIVFFSSIMSVVGDAGKSLYGMTKGALVSGAKSLACEYASKKIRINCISPGAIETPINFHQPYMSDPIQRADFEKKHLLGFGVPTDISNACIYLLSDASRWLTGQNIIIDGGYTTR